MFNLLLVLLNWNQQQLILHKILYIWDYYNIKTYIKVLYFIAGRTLGWSSSVPKSLCIFPPQKRKCVNICNLQYQVYRLGFMEYEIAWICMPEKCVCVCYLGCWWSVECHTRRRSSAGSWEPLWSRRRWGWTRGSCSEHISAELSI